MKKPLYLPNKPFSVSIGHAELFWLSTSMLTHIDILERITVEIWYFHLVFFAKGHLSGWNSIFARYRGSSSTVNETSSLMCIPPSEKYCCVLLTLCFNTIVAEMFRIVEIWRSIVLSGYSQFSGFSSYEEFEWCRRLDLVI